MANIIELISHTQRILNDLKIKIKRDNNVNIEELMDIRNKVNSKFDQMVKLNLDNTKKKFMNIILNKSNEYTFITFPLKDIKIENIQSVSKKIGMDISEFFTILSNYEIDKKSSLLVYFYQENSFIFNIEFDSPKNPVPIVRIISKNIKKGIPEFKALCRDLGYDLYHLDIKLNK